MDAAMDSQHSKKKHLPIACFLEPMGQLEFQCPWPNDPTQYLNALELSGALNRDSHLLYLVACHTLMTLSIQISVHTVDTMAQGHSGLVVNMFAFHLSGGYLICTFAPLCTEFARAPFCLGVSSRYSNLLPESKVCEIVTCLTENGLMSKHWNVAKLTRLSPSLGKFMAHI